MAKYVNKLCERFASLGIKTVIFTYYDINENKAHASLKYSKGNIFLYNSSNDKETYTGQLSVT